MPTPVAFGYHGTGGRLRVGLHDAGTIAAWFLAPLEGVAGAYRLEATVDPHPFWSTRRPLGVVLHLGPAVFRYAALDIDSFEGTRLVARAYGAPERIRT